MIISPVISRLGTILSLYCSCDCQAYATLCHVHVSPLCVVSSSSRVILFNVAGGLFALLLNRMQRHMQASVGGCECVRQSVHVCMHIILCVLMCVWVYTKSDFAVHFYSWLHPIDHKHGCTALHMFMGIIFVCFPFVYFTSSITNSSTTHFS